MPGTCAGQVRRGNDDAHVLKGLLQGAQGGVHVQQALRGMGHVPVAAGNDRASVRTEAFQRGQDLFAVPVAQHQHVGVLGNDPDAVVQGFILRHRGMAHRISLGDHAPPEAVHGYLVAAPGTRARLGKQCIQELVGKQRNLVLGVRLQQFGGLEEMPELLLAVVVEEGQVFALHVGGFKFVTKVQRLEACGNGHDNAPLYDGGVVGEAARRRKRGGPPASNLRFAVAILGVDVGKAGEAHTVAALLAVRAHPDEVFSFDRNPVVVQQVQALPFIQVRAVLLHVRFHEGMAAAGREGQDVHVHVEAFVHGQQIAHEHVFHVVVDALFDVVGIAEHGVGLHRGIGMRDVALLVEQEAQGA